MVFRKVIFCQISTFSHKYITRKTFSLNSLRNAANFDGWTISVSPVDPPPPRSLSQGICKDRTDHLRTPQNFDPCHQILCCLLHYFKTYIQQRCPQAMTHGDFPTCPCPMHRFFFFRFDILLCYWHSEGSHFHNLLFTMRSLPWNVGTTLNTENNIITKF